VLNPFYESDLVLQITQPLLRDFGSEVNRARIVIARNNQKISLLDFRKTVEDNLTDLEKAYWQLVEAERDVKIQEALLARTLETGDILFKRRTQDVTRVQISQANASIEQRRATLVRERARVRDLSDQIKQLMYDPEYPVSSPVLILPGSDPTMEPIHFDLNEQIDAALDNRLELLQQLARVDNASVTLGAAKNNLLPQLNLVGSIGANGVAGNWDAAISNQSDINFLSWSLGLQFEVPIGNRAARAIYRRTLLQRQQAVDQYRSLIEQISLDVKTAMREVQTTWDEMVATRQASFASEDALLAIEQRKAANEPLTPTFVQLELDAQERLANARREEAAAITNYQIGISRLEKAKGTLLRYNNVVMDEEKQIVMR
jgi:outer membrane protein TolC